MATNENVRANRVSRMLNITEKHGKSKPKGGQTVANDGKQKADGGNKDANQALSLLGNVYKNKFDLAALSKVWENLKANNAIKPFFNDANFKKLSGAVEAMVTANSQGQQAQEGAGNPAAQETGAPAGGTGGTSDPAAEETGGAPTAAANGSKAPGQGQKSSPISDISFKRLGYGANKKDTLDGLNSALQSAQPGKPKQGIVAAIKLINSMKEKTMNYAYILNESADPFADFDKMTGFTGADEKDLCRPFDEGYAHCQQAMQNGKCGPQPKKVPYPRNSKEAEDYVSGWESAWMDGDDFIRR